MLITKTSMFSGKSHTLDLPVTEEELARWKQGELIQVVFPHLSPDDREFLMTGVTKEEWAATFSEDM